MASESCGPLSGILEEDGLFKRAIYHMYVSIILYFSKWCFLKLWSFKMLLDHGEALSFASQGLILCVHCFIQLIVSILLERHLHGSYSVSGTVLSALQIF